MLIRDFKKVLKFIWLRIRKKGPQRRQSFIFWPEYFRYAGQLVQLVSVKLILQSFKNEKQGKTTIDASHARVGTENKNGHISIPNEKQGHTMDLYKFFFK